jgi:hypothetical protein
VEGRTHAEFSGRNPHGVPEFKAAQDLLIVLREMIQSYRPIRTISASALQHRAEEQGKMLLDGEDRRDQLDRTVPLVLRMPEIMAFEQVGMFHSFDLTGLKVGDRFLGCPNCGWHLPPDAACPNKCPQCQGALWLVTVTEEDKPKEPT